MMNNSEKIIANFKLYLEWCTLNQFININRTHKYSGSKQKKKCTNFIKIQLLNEVVKLGYDGEEYSVNIIWNYYTREDLDNIMFQQKFVFDGMIEAKVLKDDNYKIIKKITHEFKRCEKYKNKPFCIVQFMKN